MGQYVYVVRTDVKLLEEQVDRKRLSLGPRKGLKRRKVFYVYPIDEPRRYESNELKKGATYEFLWEHEYSLEIGCRGRDWHTILGELVGYGEKGPDLYAPGGPFIELLHPDYFLSIFGPQASAKLVADFDTWDERARHFSDAEFYIAYLIARAAFARAAQNGASAVECLWIP